MKHSMIVTALLTLIFSFTTMVNAEMLESQIECDSDPALSASTPETKSSLSEITVADQTPSATVEKLQPNTQETTTQYISEDHWLALKLSLQVVGLLGSIYYFSDSEACFRFLVIGSLLR